MEVRNCELEVGTDIFTSELLTAEKGIDMVLHDEQVKGLENNVLRINMLGEFTLTYNDVVLTECSRRSRKMWTLLQYMIAFHDREISQNELVDLMWAKEDIDNPIGALKTQLHRLRTTLKRLGMADQQSLIINSMHTYRFNEAIPIYLDFDYFEKLYKRSQKLELTDDERIEIYKEAFTIYKGDFLHKVSEEQWVTPINAYYHSIYLRMVHNAVDIFYKKGRNTDIIETCRKAVIIDAFDEKLHYYLIKSLAAMGEHQEARSHYLYVLDLFYSVQGISPSKELTELYDTTIKSVCEDRKGIEEIKAELSEESDTRGAFFCEFELFKYIYTLDLRIYEREDLFPRKDAPAESLPDLCNRDLYLCLITLSDPETSVIEPKIMQKAMEKLKKTLITCLRSSDVFARYSASQYVLMFQHANAETCDSVSQRVKKRFKVAYSKTNIVMQFAYMNATNEQDGDPSQ